MQSIKSITAKNAVARASPKVVVRPSPKLALAGAAALAGLAAAAAPAEAATMLHTVASAAEGYPFVPPSWAPSVLVPLTGLVIPGVAMATLFSYIEKEA